MFVLHAKVSIFAIIKLTASVGFILEIVLMFMRSYMIFKLPIKKHDRTYKDYEKHKYRWYTLSALYITIFVLTMVFSLEPVAESMI